MATGLDTSNIITNFAPNSLIGATPGVNTISNPITSGSGSGATIVVVIGLGSVVTSVVATVAGSGYAVGDTITILAGQITGSTVDLVITLGANDINGFFALPGTTEEVVGPRLVTNPMVTFPNLSPVSSSIIIPAGRMNVACLTSPSLSVSTSFSK